MKSSYDNIDSPYVRFLGWLPKRRENKIFLVLNLLVFGCGLITALIGLFGRSKEDTGSSEGFLLGGRSLGPVITVASLTMGILSGMRFTGLPR